MIKKNCFNNCFGQSTISSIFTLLIVVVLTVLPFHFAVSEYSNSGGSSVSISDDNLEVLQQRVGIESLVDGTLYLNSGKSMEIHFVKIGDIDCEISGKYSGVTKFDVSMCLNNINEVSPKIIVSTNEGVFSDEYFIEKNMYTKFELEK